MEPLSPIPEVPTPESAGSTRSASTALTGQNISDLFLRLEKVENGNTDLVQTQTEIKRDMKALQEGQKDITHTLKEMQENMGLMIQTGISRAMQNLTPTPPHQSLLTPTPTPPPRHNPHQEREYALFQNPEKRPWQPGDDNRTPLSPQDRHGNETTPQGGLAGDIQDQPEIQAPEGLTKKLEMPIFEGCNTFAWLSKVDRFFRLGRFSDEQKLDFVSMSLDGDAIGWFNSELVIDPFHNWNDFKSRLLLRFGNVLSRGPSQTLCCLKQNGLVKEYVARFEDLVSQVSLDVTTLEGIFLNGLKKSLREVVLLMKPNSLAEMRAYALSMESEALTRMVAREHQQELSMDFIDGLPMSQGFNSIFVVVDRLSKFAHFIALRHPYSALTVAQKFIAEIVKLHGFPVSIVSDRDRIFLSQFWKDLFRLSGTKLKYSTSYHPETDGQTERLNQCLENYLRCFASSQPRSWHQFLSWAELWYNSSFHTALNTTPFRVVYGRDPPPILRFEEGSTSNFELEAALKERDKMLGVIKEQLVRAQDAMKRASDKHRRDLEFSIGTWVYLKLRPYRQMSVVRRVCQKLAAKFFGPFQVTERIGKVAYRLLLPGGSKIHDVFHISQLKEAKGNHTTVLPLPPLLQQSDQLVIEPEIVLDTRYSKTGDLEALVKWQGFTNEDNEWVLVQTLVQQFPHFELGDKLLLKGGSIVKPLKVYFRKKYRTNDVAVEKESVLEAKNACVKQLGINHKAEEKNKLLEETDKQVHAQSWEVQKADDSKDNDARKKGDVGGASETQP